MNTDELIELLLNPDSYPHPVEVITTLETHISVVFLTGQFAYKLKKPVDFGFLDFSSLENRKRFCEMEVALNKRTAPELYLGVYQIQFSTDFKDTGNQVHSITIKQADELNQANEYLVKMRQFDPNSVLGRMLKDDSMELSDDIIEQLATQIAQFHLAAEHVDQNSILGEPKTQLQPMLDNFPSLQETFCDDETQIKLKRLEEWTLEKFAEVEELLKERKKAGFVRACHGDMHLDNIALIDNQPLLFDGIEFNEHFRWIDVISDLAFLLSDLDFRGKQAISLQLLSSYLSKTLDYNGLILLNFYRVYRTMVRAKITALRGEQLTKDSYEQRLVFKTSKQYIDQALTYLEQPKKLKNILLQGVSGSGKSHFANQLNKELPQLVAITINSDRIRKTLFGIASTERPNELEKEQLYSVAMNQKTYEKMRDYAKLVLQSGFNVIVDATFLKQQQRERFYEMARELKVQNYLIHLSISEKEASAAIRLRQSLGNNPSDADVAIMQNQLQNLQAPAEDEYALSIDAQNLRLFFPTIELQDYLELPIQEL